MANKPDRIINMHGHIRDWQDLAARVEIWRQWNVEKFVVLLRSDNWGERRGGGLTTSDWPNVQRQYPDLLVGFAGANMQGDSIDGPAEIERYADQGFVGLKAIAPKHPYNHEAYFGIYEKAQDLGMPILFHTGFLAVDYTTDGRYGIDSENMRPYLFDRIARTFPRLKIIGAHLGGPHYAEALQMLDAHENVYFDISGGSGKKRHQRKIISAMLPHPGLETDWTDPAENPALGWFEKIVFGTDSPEPDVWVPAAENILDALHIPAELRQRFYYDTAAELLGLR